MGQDTTSAKDVAASFSEGEDVEYFSTSKDRWLECKIASVSQGGEIEVSIKPGFPFMPDPSNLRKVLAAPAGNDEAASLGFTLGDDVEYFSESKNQWIASKISNVGSDGRVEVSIKPGHPFQPDASKLRKVSAKAFASRAGNFAQGERVEYFSASKNRWLEGEILNVSSGGEVEVSIKPGFPFLP